MPTAVPANTEVNILGRLFFNGRERINPSLARHILRLRFCDEDRARMHELAAKNQEGTISKTELRELDSYVKAGDLLAILKLKARKVVNIKAH